MGQFYKVIILTDNKQKKEKVRLWMCPSRYMNGLKLTEHSYINNNFIMALEYLISCDGMFHMSRLVWAGDYADPEELEDDNLYNNTIQNGTFQWPPIHDTSEYRYIVNHTKKLYVDKNLCKELHPLPLLVSEGNERGGGDYYGNNKELCGTWARDCISVEKTIPDDFVELKCDFYEE